MSPQTILQLLRVRAVEESDTLGEKLSWRERESATREAMRLAGKPGQARGAEGLTGPQWRFLSARAGLLAGTADAVTGHPGFRMNIGRWGAALCLAAFAIGWISHGMGLSRSFDLLAGPFVLILLWNAAVYALLICRLFQTPGKDGKRGWVSTLMEKRVTAAAGREGDGKAREVYLKSVAAWLRSWSGPATVSWFHAGSAFFTLGLLAAVYFRGLFTGYLAAWESTWLDAGGIHAILGTLLGPASIITGIPLPDSIESWDLLRRTAGHPGADAGPWIHLYAVTLAGWVLLPRAVLSLSAWFHAKRRRSCPPPWTQDDPYVLRLLSLARQDGDIGIAVLPFDIKNPALPGTGPYQDRIERLVREVWGLEARPCWLQCAPYGSEDSAWEGPWAEAEKCGGALLLLDVHATPEDEVHGRVLNALLQRFSRSRGGVIVAVECSRFAAGRLDVRLGLWQQFAQQHHCGMLPLEQGAARDPSVPPASRLVRHP
ncbi:MAG: DUF2868 domain-containing protein [Akkermansiaceae bacterium]|jgi:hypothetical protein|nr:DUF2868 domain-containing protein [Akkermansiaceae bacterium]MCU0776542.1 DUF2868 domain-containing protein [Akkermansiaceae bacterium]